MTKRVGSDTVNGVTTNIYYRA